MHPALLTAYARNLDRLEAEEDLRAIMVVAAGTGSLKKEASREYLRELSRAVRADEPAPKASIADVKAMGIRVKEVPRG